MEAPPPGQVPENKINAVYVYYDSRTVRRVCRVYLFSSIIVVHDNFFFRFMAFKNT